MSADNNVVFYVLISFIRKSYDMSLRSERVRSLRDIYGFRHNEASGAERISIVDFMIQQRVFAAQTPSSAGKRTGPATIG